eukprot:431312-Amphidinium_carterae.1
MYASWISKEAVKTGSQLVPRQDSMRFSGQEVVTKEVRQCLPPTAYCSRKRAAKDNPKTLEAKQGTKTKTKGHVETPRPHPATFS